MSAYIVSKNHILYLVTAALSRKICLHGCHWWPVPGESYKTLRACDYPLAEEMANLLWRENLASVSCRYPNESSATLPGAREKRFIITRRDLATVFEFDPVQVFKACDCYEYQSCEHAGWHASEARAFIEGLRQCAWQALPGYDDAEWGAPEPHPGVCLSALI
jgi:hypothetical protein